MGGASPFVNTLKPKTCRTSPKLPVPGPRCVQVTEVPSSDTCGLIQQRDVMLSPLHCWRLTVSALFGSDPGGKSVEVGLFALMTPSRPESVIFKTSPGAGQTA